MGHSHVTYFFFFFFFFPERVGKEREKHITSLKWFVTFVLKSIKIICLWIPVNEIFTHDLIFYIFCFFFVGDGVFLLILDYFRNLYKKSHNRVIYYRRIKYAFYSSVINLQSENFLYFFWLLSTFTLHINKYTSINTTCKHIPQDVNTFNITTYNYSTITL